MRLEGCDVKRMWPIFKTEILIYQSKANLNEKILFGKITYHMDKNIGKMLVDCKSGNKDSTFHSVP